MHWSSNDLSTLPVCLWCQQRWTAWPEGSSTILFQNFQKSLRESTHDRKIKQIPPPQICNENCYALLKSKVESSIGSCTYWLEVPNSPPIWTYLYHPIPSSSYLFYSTSIHNSSKTLHQQSWWRDQVSQLNAPRSERCYSPLRWCRNSSVKVDTGIYPTHSRPYPCNRSSNLTGTSCFYLAHPSTTRCRRVVMWSWHHPLVGTAMAIALALKCRWPWRVSPALLIKSEIEIVRPVLPLQCHLWSNHFMTFMHLPIPVRNANLVNTTPSGQTWNHF